MASESMLCSIDVHVAFPVGVMLLGACGSGDQEFFNQKRREAAEAEAERLKKEQELLGTMTEEEKAVGGNCVSHVFALLLRYP